VYGAFDFVEAFMADELVVLSGIEKERK